MYLHLCQALLVLLVWRGGGACGGAGEFHLILRHLLQVGVGGGSGEFRLVLRHLLQVRGDGPVDDVEGTLVHAGEVVLVVRRLNVGIGAEGDEREVLVLGDGGVHLGSRRPGSRRPRMPRMPRRRLQIPLNKAASPQTRQRLEDAALFKKTNKAASSMTSRNKAASSMTPPPFFTHFSQQGSVSFGPKTPCQQGSVMTAIQVRCWTG